MKKVNRFEDLYQYNFTKQIKKYILFNFINICDLGTWQAEANKLTASLNTTRFHN